MPPPLPKAHPISRLCRLARMDALSVLVLSALFGIGSIFSRDWPTVVGSVFACSAAVLELRGVRRCQEGDSAGISWLIRAQALLMLTILGYCAWRLWHPDLAHLSTLISPSTRQMVEAAGLSFDDLMRLVYPLTYTILALASLIAQGAMIFHYARQKKHFAPLP